MDKRDALKISKKYLRKIRKSDLDCSEAWLFGSYATGNQNDDSDIDIAIVFSDDVTHTFELEVKLMVIRKGDETLIEPHAFSQEEFDQNYPFVNQIVKYGERIQI